MCSNDGFGFDKQKNYILGQGTIILNKHNMNACFSKKI